MDDTFPTIRNIGLDGLLVSFAGVQSDAANRAALAFRAHVDALNWPEISESASTLVSAFFRIDLVAHGLRMMESRLRAELAEHDWFGAALPENRKRWTIPVCFEDGPKLAEAAQLAGLEPDQAIDDLCAAPIRVLTLGFAPGMPYAGYLPEHWDIPRQQELTQVPTGAVVVAVRQAIIFANTSPTGWRHVGHSAFRCFRPQSDTPVVLRAGDEIALTPVSTKEMSRIVQSDLSGNGGAECKAL